MSGQWKPLDEGGHLIEGLLLMERRRWPGLRALWLWVRQGRPRDYPVIVQEGTISAIASAVDPDGSPVIDAEDVTIRGWAFSHSLLPPGGIRTHDVIYGLLARRTAEVVFPDGHVERRYLQYGEQR